MAATPRRGPPRLARPSSPLVDDAEGLCAKDAECSCAPTTNGGRKCTDPAVCEHLEAGVACAHPSPFLRQLLALRLLPLGALPGVRFARSEVGDCGSGVVSTREFLPGTPLMLYTGRATHVRPPRSNEYVMSLPPSVSDPRPLWLVGDPAACLATRANHSCNPNVDVAKLRFHGGSSEPLVVFYAKRRVRGLRHAPVRLTLSYDFEDAEARSVACACGSRQCCGLFGCSPELCAKRRRAQAQAQALVQAAAGVRVSSEAASGAPVSCTVGGVPVGLKHRRRPSA